MYTRVCRSGLVVLGLRRTTPFTLHPTPYTLRPTPYTLHPTSYALHPTPYALHPGRGDEGVLLRDLHALPLGGGRVRKGGQGKRHSPGLAGYVPFPSTKTCWLRYRQSTGETCPGGSLRARNTQHDPQP